MPVVFSQYYFLDSESKTFEPGNHDEFVLNHRYICNQVLIRFLFILGKVVITTLPPIPTKGMTRDDLEILSDMARQQMIEVFNESSKDLVKQKKIAI